jgi:ABC-type phosphate/phosphonate transport system substrate-binding protein
MKHVPSPIIAGLAAALSLGSSALQAAPKDYAIYVTRLGGDTQSAQPFIARFSGYVEESLGWPRGSFKGVFFVDKQEAQAFIKKSRPGLAVLEPPLYFELRKSEKLAPIAQLESKDLVSSKLHLVVKDPRAKTLADLKGKRLWTPLAESPVYLSKVVLGGAVDAKAHFALKRVGQALKGVRALLRGEADATILDDEQLALARKMEGGAALKAIHSSPALPALPLVVFGKSLKPAEQKALVQLLIKMCGTAKGGPICKEMRIDRFSAPKTQLFQETQARFEK